MREGAILFVVAMAACASPPVVTPDPPRHDVVVLLRDAETGAVGRAVVTAPTGSVVLAAGGQAARVSREGRPVAEDHLDDAAVSAMFASPLAALPPPPISFTLFFEFESEELTAESRAVVPGIVSALRERPAPDVAVVGHTDTMGDDATNAQWGYRRAVAVRTLLVEAGLPLDAISVRSHGERDPLVHTAENTREPRNRRVEIVVR